LFWIDLVDLPNFYLDLFSTFQNGTGKNTYYAVQVQTLCRPVLKFVINRLRWQSLMKNQISDSQVGPIELDYMINNDQWVSGLDPVDFPTRFWGTKLKGM
jgi:hypothetical protein